MRIACDGPFGHGGIVFAKARFDDPVRHVPDDRQEDDRHCRDEEPVARDVRSEIAENRLDRRFGDAEQQRVQLAGQEVGGKPARYAGKGGSDARDRMASGGVEDDTGQRDQHDIRCVGSQIAQHADKHHDGRQDRDRRIANACAHGGTEQSGPLGDACAQHHDEHVAKRMEVRECLGHLDPEPRDVLRAQEALRRDDSGRACIGINLRRVRGRQAQKASGNRDDDQYRDQPEEEEHRIGQLVAASLDPSQNTLRLGCRGCCRHVCPGSCSAISRTRYHCRRPLSWG